MVVKVAIYTRISDDTEGLAKGVKRQEQDCRALAVRRGWDVFEPIRQDNDISAFSTKVVRPAFEVLLDDLRTGAIGGVVTWDLDRFARQPSDLERAIRIFDDRPSLVFATVQSDIDLSSPDGRTMARVMVTFANKSSMDTSRRLKRKHLEMAEQGKVVGSHRPFGYEGDKVTIRASEATLIREAASDILAGIGTHAIARRWNELGMNTPQGNTWVQTVVRNMMLSPRMAGYRVHHKKIALDRNGQPVMAQRPAILDVATWESVCAVIQDPTKRGNHIHRGGRKRLLAGLVRCGVCSVVMSGDKDARKGTHLYVCKPATTHRGCGKVAVAGERVDELVTDLVISYLSQREVRHSAVPWPDESELNHATNRITELMSAYTKGDLSGDVVFPAVGSLEAQTATLRAEKQAWLREQTVHLSQPSDIAGTWHDLNIDQRRAVIESVLTSVIVNPAAIKGGRFSPDRVEVLWRQ
jgi:site-specific DNA recombinase